MTGVPADARPASTVVVLRPAARDAYEVLLVRRNDKVAFMGGAFVFPGGRVDAADHDPGHRAGFLSAPARFADISPEEELPYRVAAVRELSEEASLAVTIDDGSVKDLTPFDKTQAQVQQVSPKFPNDILVGLNNRDPKFHDLHKVNLTTGKLELVDTVYGDDEDTKSYTEAQGLMTKYPDLKVIIAPTTVGIAASARAVQDANKVGTVFVTGLGTPNQMREYVKSGAAPQFALWNPADLGYLAIQMLHAIASGQIKGQPVELYLVYPEGNHITVPEQYPFLQIGETKYGKPILDRIIRPDCDHETAMRCALVSMDSTMRSNATVGPPVELLFYQTDSLDVPAFYAKLDESDPYLVSLRRAWDENIRKAFNDLPSLYQVIQAQQK